MRPTFKQSHETQAIVKLLTQIPIGQEISFAEASKAVGFSFDALTPAYQSAKRAAQRDHNVVIEGIRGHGFTRINAVGMVERASRFFARVRKGSRREAHVQEIAIMSNLPRDAMITATEQLSRLRILETTAISPRKAASNRAETEPVPLVEATVRPGRRK